MTIGLRTLALLLAASTSDAGSDGPGRVSAWVTTLGNEVVAVESCMRTAERLSGDIVLRVPGTTRYHYSLTFQKDGSVRKSEFTIKPLGAPGVDEHRRLEMEFGREGVRVVSVVQGETQVAHRSAGPSPNVLFLGGYASSYGLYGSFGMYEHLLSRLPVHGSESMSVETFSADTGKISIRQFKRLSPTEGEISFFKMAWMQVALDGSGNIVSADATATTERTLTKRVESLDVDRIEREFVALDRAKKGLGEISPNVETRATILGAPVAVKYGSPRLRGRSGVSRALAASGAVWRTGANEATTIDFGRDMIVGNVRVPAGRYSLWTQVRGEGAELIINKEAGQWGTEYHKGMDLARVTLQTAVVDSPIENFTIGLVNGGSGWELLIEWDTFRWSTPLSPGADPGRLDR